MDNNFFYNSLVFPKSYFRVYHPPSPNCQAFFGECFSYFPVPLSFVSVSTVGENLKYLVFDREHNPLACLLFGSAAWKCAPRDDFIGSRCQDKKGQSQIPDQ
jgi:hypothetical protein